jgi:hypothetical protein
MNALDAVVELLLSLRQADERLQVWFFLLLGARKPCGSRSGRSLRMRSERASVGRADAAGSPAKAAGRRAGRARERSGAASGSPHASPPPAAPPPGPCASAAGGSVPSHVAGEPMGLQGDLQRREEPRGLLRRTLYSIRRMPRPWLAPWLS